METNLTKGRNSNIEMLRIISMLLIIGCHYSTHALIAGRVEYSYTRYIAGVELLGGGFGDVLFVIISGYFMCTKRFTGRKLAKLYGEVFFYSVTFWGGLTLLKALGCPNVLMGYDTLRIIKRGIMSFIPIGYSNYWFATYYVVLMVISPLLNIILQQLTKRQLQICLLITTVFWSIIPIFTKAEYAENDLVWFLVLYLYAGYIRMHVELNHDYRWNLIIAVAAYAIVILSAVSMIYVGHITGIDQFIIACYRFSFIHSPFVLLCCVETILAALKMQPRHNRWINRISTTTFGIYLIHNNEMFKPVLFNGLSGMIAMIVPTDHVLRHSLCVIAITFIVCSVMDAIRQQTVERWYLRMLDRWQPACTARCVAITQRMTELLSRVVR